MLLCYIDLSFLSDDRESFQAFQLGFYFKKQWKIQNALDFSVGYRLH